MALTWKRGKDFGSDGEVPDHGRWLTGLNTVKAQAEALTAREG